MTPVFVVVLRFTPVCVDYLWLFKCVRVCACMQAYVCTYYVCECVSMCKFTLCKTLSVHVHKNILAMAVEVCVHVHACEVMRIHVNCYVCVCICMSVHKCTVCTTMSVRMCMRIYYIRLLAVSLCVCVHVSEVMRVHAMHMRVCMHICAQIHCTTMSIHTCALG